MMACKMLYIKCHLMTLMKLSWNWMILVVLSWFKHFILMVWDAKKNQQDM